MFAENSRLSREILYLSYYPLFSVKLQLLYQRRCNQEKYLGFLQRLINLSLFPKEIQKERNNGIQIFCSYKIPKNKQKSIADCLINLISSGLDIQGILERFFCHGAVAIYRFSPGRGNNLKLVIVTIRHIVQKNQPLRRKARSSKTARCQCTPGKTKESLHCRKYTREIKRREAEHDEK